MGRVPFNIKLYQMAAFDDSHTVTNLATFMPFSVYPTALHHPS